MISVARWLVNRSISLALLKAVSATNELLGKASIAAFNLVQFELVTTCSARRVVKFAMSPGSNLLVRPYLPPLRTVKDLVGLMFPRRLRRNIAATSVPLSAALTPLPAVTVSFPARAA